MKKTYFAFPLTLAVLAFTFSGCQEKDLYDSNYRPNDGKEISNLDFSTTRSIELKPDYNISEGFISTYDVYTENPFNEDGTFKTELEPITSGISIAGKEITRTLPAYATELYLYSTDLFVPQLMYAKVTNGVASFKQVAVPAAVVNRSVTRSIASNSVDYYLKGENDFTRGQEAPHPYDLKEPDLTRTIPAEVLTAISHAFPEYKYAKKEYRQDVTLKITKGKSGDTGAEVFLSILGAGSSADNSFSYFIYEGEKELNELTPKERSELEIINIFQYADAINNSYESKGKGLTPGKYIQLKYKNSEGIFVNEFPIGAQIGFVLHSQGFDETNFKVKDDCTWIYSIAKWNSEPNKKRTIQFQTTDRENNVYRCFGFEDRLDSGSDNDCNDLMFHIIADPVQDDVPPIVPGTIEKERTVKGLLTFEDNWPKKGDYDLNDIMVSYSSKIAYVQTGEWENGELTGTPHVKQVTDRISFIHAGATFDNGFSYKVQIPRSKVNSVKVQQPGKYYFDTCPTIDDGDGFIIDLCPNVLDVITPMQTGIKPAVYTVKMEFKENAVTEEDFEPVLSPYNPFIIPQNASIDTDGDIEVHLPHYTPTQRIGNSLFGFHNDVSKPNKGIYYVAEEGINYPFALHLSGIESITIPKEESPISETYSDYDKWVKSGCSEFTDWYLNPSN